MTKTLSITLRTRNYGNDGIILLMGNAGFISSTVAPVAFLGLLLLRPVQSQRLAFSSPTRVYWTTTRITEN